MRNSRGLVFIIMFEFISNSFQEMDTTWHGEVEKTFSQMAFDPNEVSVYMLIVDCLLIL